MTGLSKPSVKPLVITLDFIYMKCPGHIHAKTKSSLVFARCWCGSREVGKERLLPGSVVSLQNDNVLEIEVTVIEHCK